ncbi:MAG TPA: M20/M25/M40 family metallo-hydrolase [Allosphingosinicella sp.]|jgi:acetylornithine deacetylase/succinyl-diaminopimelate desuccinylase-like protein
MIVPGIAAALLVLAAPAAAAADGAADAKQILKKSIGFRTVKGEGQVAPYAAYLASVLKAAGFAEADVEIAPVGDTATLMARYRGSDPKLKPIVLLGHMDVVEAKAADWERDPFTAVEENGYIFGRGSEDNKFDVSMIVATLARLKSEGYKPRRGIVLALSGGEETDWISTRQLADALKGAELVLNGDAGGGILGEKGEPILYRLQAGEKTYADFVLEVTDPGGHSSAPTASNAIYRLAHALDRIGSYKFRPMANELTKASLRAASRRVGGELGAAMTRFAADPGDAAAAELISSKPEYIGQIRTTCVATMVNAGHARNALPQRATANVNCRIYPGVQIDTVKQELTRVIADPAVKIGLSDEDNPFADASPLRPDVMKAVTKAVKARYSGLDVTPSMSAGATDSLIFRAAGIPSYGVSGLFQRSEDNFAHGLNERVPVSQIAPALMHWRTIVTELTR